MPARDIYHDTVIHALEADGWRITDDPFSIPVGRKQLFVDLGAEKLIGAEREGRRIAVEIKTFEEPIGQGIMDRFELKLIIFDPDEETILQWIPKF
jgi:hypothetical protein